MSRLAKVKHLVDKLAVIQNVNIGRLLPGNQADFQHQEEGEGARWKGALSKHFDSFLAPLAPGETAPLGTLLSCQSLDAQKHDGVEKTLSSSSGNSRSDHGGTTIKFPSGGELKWRACGPLPSCLLVSNLARGGAVIGFAAIPASRSFSAASHTNKRENEAPDLEQRRTNRAITSATVRLVTDEGHEVLPTNVALRRAQEANLDLVEVNGKADPPACRILDYGRFRFEERKREKEQRKKHVEKRRMDEVKEVRMTSRTEAKDLEMKVDTAKKLLAKGYRVKCTVNSRKDSGDAARSLLDQMIASLGDSAVVENGPRDEGNRSWALFRAARSFQKEAQERQEGMRKEGANAIDQSVQDFGSIGMLKEEAVH